MRGRRCALRYSPHEPGAHQPPFQGPGRVACLQRQRATQLAHYAPHRSGQNLRSPRVVEGGRTVGASVDRGAAPQEIKESLDDGSRPIDPDLQKREDDKYADKTVQIRRSRIGRLFSS